MPHPPPPVATPPLPELATARLLLTPLDARRDAAALHPVLGDPEAHRYGGGAGSWPEPSADPAETERRLTAVLGGNGGATWAVMERDGPGTANPGALGLVGLFDGPEAGPVRGLSWGIRPDHWGRGYAGEAARAAVEYLLGLEHIAAVEAWIDARNTRSLGVARRAGLDERARLPRVYPAREGAERCSQQVVMAREAHPELRPVLAVRPVLEVADAGATAEALVRVLGLHESFRFPDDPGGGAELVRLAVDRFSGSPGLDLRLCDATRAGEVARQRIMLDTSVPAAAAYGAVRAEPGFTALAPPERQPWFRTEFTLRLPEGHEITVSAPE